MKAIIIFLSLFSTLLADPQLTSWFTQNSDKYARIYETKEDEDIQNSVTTWNRGAGIQLSPTYSGIHEISTSTNWLYIRTTGLASHIMGPWYGNVAKTNLFPNYPSNTDSIYRIPRKPTFNTDPDAKSPTTLGAAGYSVNGVAMFNCLDAFSYSNSNADDARPNSAYNGDGIWNRDAYVNESVTFDPAFAHQAGNTYHYHANAPGIRHQLGDSVDYDATTNTYTENPGATPKHSPIIGWAADGYPVYGPYGYSDPNNSASTVTRMTSGYTLSSITQRTSLPQWAANFNDRTTTLTATEHGPAVSANFPLGHYAEDNQFTGTGSLDLYNGRNCITPEYPAGTYAYFITIEADGTPVYPYTFAVEYYGNATGDNVNNITEPVTIRYEGGPESNERNQDITTNNDNLTLTWSTIEGGKYNIQSSTTLEDNSWVNEQINVQPDTNMLNYTAASALADLDKKFFRLKRTELANFDDTGFDYTNTTPPVLNNILLLIVDDWGIDASVFDNTSTDPSISFAPMPNLQTIVNNGVRFTNAYAQPTCSVTRASIITGRHPFRTTVGNPQTDNTLPDSEIALPEAFTAQSSPYALASYGKWHLGSGATGPLTNGGWTEFRGILSGGVTSYTDWSKTENGVTTDNVTTYTTTDQVNEATTFITAQGTDPWFVWVGFNAPHTPYHNPPSGLGTYPAYPETNGEVTGVNRRPAYQAALEALDTEIGRLLQSVDLTKTNIIIIGDNGTPGGVVQAPYDSTHAKGSLFEGGTHVPLFAAGPDIHITGTSDKLVHCVDLYSTILELADITPSAAAPGVTIDSKSLVPIFNGADTTDRCVITEQFGSTFTTGRGIISDDYPDYKLLILGHPTDISDTPQFFLYNITLDPNEQSPINLTTLTPAEQIIYDHLLAKDTALGGGYSDPASTQDTLYLELPNTTGPSSPPQNLSATPSSITIDGVAATFVGRLDQTDTEDRYWIKCTISPEAATYTSAVVEFTNLPGGNADRTFNAIQVIEAP